MTGDACHTAAQEMASRGLAAVYDMADEATRKALLDSLVATLSGEAAALGSSYGQQLIGRCLLLLLPHFYPW